MSTLINDSDTVIVKTLDNKCSYILKVSGDQKLGRSRVNLKQLVGNPYGSVFELIDRKLVLVNRAENVNDYEVANDNETDDQKGNNSTYVDNNTAQKLTSEDISKLKEAGKSGGEIIQSLINNSDTFASKTDYAQEKWIKRKEKKYRTMYRVTRCTPYNLCECSFEKSRDKVCGLRADSLAQVIAQSGVYSGCRVLVVESMVGLVVGSVAYRMRGQGRILSVYGSQQPHLEMILHLNLDQASMDIVQLAPAAEDVCASGFTAVPTEEHHAKKQRTEEAASSSSAVVQQHESKTGQRGSAIYNSGKGKEGQAKVRQALREGVDSLIIACKYSPLPILKQALYLLSPSSPFVLYNEFLEPLVECFLFLQQSGQAIKLSLSDTWAREFQTLPGRFRPDMFMSTSGGYILSGIYVGQVPCQYRAGAN